MIIQRIFFEYVTELLVVHTETHEYKLLKELPATDKITHEIKKS